MPKYFFFILILLTALSSQLYSQGKSTTEDVIYLNNGSVLRGLLIERVPGSHVIIQMPGDNKLRVEESNIKKLTQEKPQDYYLFKYMRNSRTKSKGLFSGRERGLALQWAINFTGSTDQWNTFVVYPGVDMKAMYHTGSDWSFGLGTGISSYGAGGIIPFYGEAQYQLGQQGQKARPFLFGQLGYGYAAWESWGVFNLSGGPMGRAGAGYIINTRRRTEWIFSLSMGLQPFNWEGNGWDWPFFEGDVNRLSGTLQLGLGMGI